MSELTAVLQYLADIAGTDGDPKPSTVVDEVIFTGVESYLGGPSPRLQRLMAIDRLRPEEHLLWCGRLWIVGTIDGVAYRWPIERQRVRVVHGNRLVGLDDWSITPGLLDRPVLDELAVRTPSGWWALTGYVNEWELARIQPTVTQRHQMAQSNREGVERLVREFLRAAGLTDDLPVIAGSIEPPLSTPAVMASNGYYLDYDPFELNRTAALRLWQGEDLDRSVLRTLYGRGSPSVDGSGPGDRGELGIRSPLPLNGPQRQAVLAARTHPLTVVSGPPGTGKSHLVAAAAIDHVAAGQSVLVATQTLHASDVVAELLDRYPMVESLRFGDTGSVRRLSDELAGGIAAPDERYDRRTLERRCSELEAEIEQHRRRLERRIGEVASFEAALVKRHDVPLWLASRDLSAIDLDATRRAVIDRKATGVLGWFTRHRARSTLRHAFGERPLDDAEVAEVIESVAAAQLVDAIAGRDLGLDELWFELERLEEQWRMTIGDLLEAKRRDAGRSKTRESVQRLASALRLGTSRRRQELTRLGSEFLEVVPLWVGTLSEIEAVLPVTPGLFDLVILDEASQISQLSSLPALARAKRAMVVGDSRQLRHVSFVSNEAMQRAASRNRLSPALASRLDDRTNSAFDAATAVAAVVELTEHFRSAPHIIGFSDRQFYGRQLQLMTQHPRNESRDAIEVVTVEGGRNAAGVVEPEVAQVIETVRELVDAGEQSIGIVSPFRSQADALEEAVLDGFSIEEIDRHRLRVGTVHSFQGTERHHMIISVGAGPGDVQALRFLEDPAIFNVMVTRARNHVVVVTCFDRESAGSGLLGAYLRHADEPPSPRRPQVHATGWTERLAGELAEHGEARIITDYEVAGETIDVVVGEGEGAFGIETEVHPGGPLRHIERRLALQRAGWEIVSLHRSSCYGREEEAIAAMLGRLARR